MTTPIWPWGPTQQTALERLEWRTRIHRNADGSERRERVRRGPRRVSSWVHTFLDVAERKEYDQTRYQHGAGPYVVPLWWDVVTPSSYGGGVTNTTFQITFEEYETREFIDGQIVAAVNLRGEWIYGEILQVITNESNNVAIIEADIVVDLASWATASAKIYPAAEARLTPSAASTSITSHFEEVSIAFEYLKPAAIPLAASGESFESINIFWLRPNQPVNWQTVDQAFSAERVDNDIGLWDVLDEVGEPLDLRAQEYRFLESRKDLWLYKRFLQRQGGQHLEMWAPTWNADIKITAIAAGVGVGEYDITVSGEVDWGAYYDGKDSRECIYLRLRDGTTHAGRITAATIGTGDTDLAVEFDAALPSTDVEDVIQCHWLERMRFASDEVTIEHRPPELASMRLSMQQIKEPAP